jgi:hypothetical protein
MKEECIAAVAKAAGRAVTAAEARDLETSLRDNMRQLARTDRENWTAMVPEERLRAAAELQATKLEQAAAKQQQRVALTIRAHTALDGYIGDAKGRGLAGLDAVERTLFEKADGKSRFTSVEGQITANRAFYLGSLLDTFEATEPRLFGLLNNPKGVRALTMEMFGQDSGSKIAKEGAKIFHDTAEAMRQRFDRAGGRIPKREDWAIPQHHDQSRVAGAGREEWLASLDPVARAKARLTGAYPPPEFSRDRWVSDTLPLVDREQYVNDDGRLMNDAEVTNFLQEAWKTIAMGGMNKVEPGVMTGRPSSMIANRGDAARQIHYRDADSYLKYQAAYGARTIDQVIAGHIAQLSRDIAMVETYGPNPDATFRFFTEREAQAQSEATPATTGKVKATVRQLDNAFNYVAGRRDPIASQLLARSFDSLRQWLIASRLGSSTITALVDEGTLHLTARVNALSQVRLAVNELATMNMANRSELAIARRGRLGLESLTSEINRWGEENLGRSFASKMAESVMTLSRLDALDAARRRALGATIYDAIGNLTQRYTRISSLAREDIGVLEGKGVTDTDWAVWRKAELSDWGNGNSHVLEPDAIMRISDADLADLTGGDANAAQRLREQATTKLLAHVLQEGNMAVPVPGFKERMISGAAMQRGTLSGELWRSMMLFKSFPLAMIRKHWSRGMGMETAAGRGAYVASLVASTTILGSISMAINDILSGKDPKQMFNAPGDQLAKNWTAAFLKGGSMGLYGDFLFSSISKNGQNDLFGALAGPVGGLVQEAMNVTQGNIIQAAEGKTTNFGAEATKMVKGLTPGSSLWYAKAALDHLIWQQLAEYLSPGWLGHMETSAIQHYNDRFWWKPGTGTAGMQAPNLARFIGH